VIDAREPGLPGLTRIIWDEHASEMTELDPAARDHLMQKVWIVEQTLRTHLAPDKINLAQLGNQVPHLHWHVIPRWPFDLNYPDAIWAAPRPQRREAWEAHCLVLQGRLPAYHAALRRALGPVDTERGLEKQPS